MSLAFVGITLNIRNNKTYPIRINVLGSPFNPLDTANAKTEYRWDITAFTPSTDDVLTLEYRPVGAAVFSTFTYQIYNTNIQSLISALDALGIGYFQSYTELGQVYLSTYNDNNEFGLLTITNNGTPATSTTTTTTTAAPTSTTTTTTTAAPTSTTTTTTTAAPTTSTTTTTTTAAPTSTTTTTTTAAPTTSTTTTTTTAAAPTSTTTTTTTAPITTSTTTSTTTLAFETFSLTYSSSAGSTACTDYSNPTNRNFYYATSGSTLTTGTILYTTSALNVPVANGFYSNGVDFWNTAAGVGNLQNQTSCNPTTTTTSTTTSTTTAANFSNTIGFGGAPEDACLPTATGSVTGNAPIFCDCTTFTGAIFAAAATGTWYVAFGGNVVSVSVINGNTLATVTSACSACSSITTTTSTTTSTTTLAFETFSLTYSSSAGSTACTDYSNPTNRNFYYATSGSTLTTGTILYTTSALNVPVANGFYSNGVDFWNTAAGVGNLQNQTSCNPTTSTTTSTTTAAPVYAFCLGYDASSQPAACADYVNCGATTVILNWSVGNQSGGALTILNNVGAQLLNITSTAGSTQSGTIFPLISELPYTIRGEWVSGSGNVIQYKLCDLTAGGTVYTSGAITNLNSPEDYVVTPTPINAQVFLTAQSVPLPTCPV